MNQARTVSRTAAIVERGDQQVVAVVAPAVLLTPAVHRPMLGTDALADAPASTQLPGSHPGSFRATLVGGSR
jgi:hypothetical protein